MTSTQMESYTSDIQLLLIANEMVERRQRIAMDAMDIILRRLDSIKKDLDDPAVDNDDVLDARAVNDAFRAFDMASKYALNPKKTIVAQIRVNNNVALFSNQKLMEARETSDKIWGMKGD